MEKPSQRLRLGLLGAFLWGPGRVAKKETLQMPAPKRAKYLPPMLPGPAEKYRRRQPVSGLTSSQPSLIWEEP